MDRGGLRAGEAVLRGLCAGLCVHRWRAVACVLAVRAVRSVSCGGGLCGLCLAPAVRLAAAGCVCASVLRPAPEFVF